MSLELKEQYRKIYTFCYHKVKNQQVAEDLTQETFLKYFSVTSYLEKGKQLAYLYTIARNNCNDYYRKTTTEQIDENIPSKDVFNEFEKSFSIKSEILKLRKDEQELLLLRFENELGIGEIATYLGISRFAVHRRLTVVLGKLKLNLHREDFYE
ncbi:MAG: RNA polymerase sigma factor [Oscillospiraceae bacterium]